MDTYWLERDFGGGGWIHSVAFSPSGEALAFAGHDSEISIAYPGVLLKTLAGYDCAPVLFEKANKE
ncbi:3379_t:CDS:2 [Rhizophagus irregularis]|nr:3379_t:CDS:2 [Rhizophagus irregularis]